MCNNVLCLSPRITLISCTIKIVFCIGQGSLKSGSRWPAARSWRVTYVEALKCCFMHSFGSTCNQYGGCLAKQWNAEMAFRKAISSWKVLQKRLVLIFIKPYRSQLTHRIKGRESCSEIEVALYSDGGRHLMRTLHTFLFLFLSYLLVVSVFFYLDYSLFLLSQYE